MEDWYLGFICDDDDYEEKPAVKKSSCQHSWVMKPLLFCVYKTCEKCGEDAGDEKVRDQEVK